MDRRAFIRAGAIAGSIGFAGCTGLFEAETQPIGVPPVPENRPDGIYVPGHVEGMEMVDTAARGDYAFGVMYSYAHRFWNVNGNSVSRTDIAPEDDVHLMTSVWDPETGIVLPETGLSVEITREGSLVSQEAIYPMLSQPMGFHYGSNFALDGDGTYTITVSVGALPTRRSGSFQDRFDEPATVEVPFEYSATARDGISFRVLEEKAGNPGALRPMTMKQLPDSLAPAEDDLPGTVVGSATSNDARLLATVLEEPPAGIDGDGVYLAVSARTRYNGMLLPAMGLEGALTREGETIFEGTLGRTLDPDLHYHYGAVLNGVEAVHTGDELTLSVTAQPQTARHEGYETAFGGLMGGMPDVTITVA